jgi:hypothetical protein
VCAARKTCARQNYPGEITKKIGVSPTYLSKVERDEFPPMPTCGTYEAGPARIPVDQAVCGPQCRPFLYYWGDSAPLRRGTPGLLVSLPTEKPPALAGRWWFAAAGACAVTDCDAGLVEEFFLARDTVEGTPLIGA